MLRFYIFASLAFLPLQLFAQATLSATRPLKLVYESKAWNKNPVTEDSGTIVMRDAKTKKIVRIQLEETGPNTNLFVGYYSVTWGDSDLVPELYIVPQDLLKTNDQVKKFESLIQEGLLLRKPYFALAEKGQQSITVFDTKEQALQALEDYRKLRNQTNSPVDRAALEAQAKAKMAAEAAAREEMEKQQTLERQKLEAEELRKQEELKKQQAALAAAEKERRHQLAQKTANEGLKLYQEDKYQEAAAKFQKATELDPSNNSFYYQYGVTLYRLNDFNKSLVILALAKGADVNPVEKEFFVASNHMKLKEFDSALNSFESVKQAKDKNLSAAAAFYMGVIQYQTENYEAAKTNFEFELDNSNDPAMDKQADAYIEQIINIMAFKREQSKKFVLTLNGGLMYDSNILSISKSEISSPTDMAGYRWVYGATFEYRPVYTYNHEFSAILSASDMYSSDVNFKPAKDFQDTDPLVFTVYLPYKYKGLVFKKGYQMTLAPGYETIQMNADGTGSRETILNSMVLKNDHTFVMNETWFATYSLEYRQDTSLMDTSSTPDDDLTATKYTLMTTQTFFQNQKKTEAWIGELGGSQNQAKGKNSSYTRFDFAATYMAPWKWDTTWTARLAFYNANYFEHTVGRMDNDTTLTLGLRKAFTIHLAGTLTGSYTENTSTYPSSDYNKYFVMTSFSWSGSL